MYLTLNHYECIMCCSMQKAALKPTTIYLPEDLHKALRIEAIEQGTSMTELARQILEDHIRKAGYKVKQHAAPKTGRGNTRRK